MMPSASYLKRRFPVGTKYVTGIVPEQLDALDDFPAPHRCIFV